MFVHFISGSVCYFSKLDSYCFCVEQYLFGGFQVVSCIFVCVGVFSECLMDHGVHCFDEFSVRVQLMFNLKVSSTPLSVLEAECHGLWMFV